MSHRIDLAKMAKEWADVVKTSGIHPRQRIIVTNYIAKTLSEIIPGLEPSKFAALVAKEFAPTLKSLMTLSEVAENTINPNTGTPYTYVRIWQLVKEKNIPVEKYGRAYFITIDNYFKYFGGPVQEVTKDGKL